MKKLFFYFLISKKLFEKNKNQLKTLLLPLFLYLYSTINLFIILIIKHIVFLLYIIISKNKDFLINLFLEQF